MNMGKIHKLSPNLADMIAAGEVVERPASVVKELVENAIDAGASQITVEIKNGGVTFMRVTDNGCGMSAEDAPTAFLRHATSKISKAEDLEAIETMGFRGEALAAISAVSRIDLLTRSEDAEGGTSVRVEAGNVLDVSPAGCPVGTTIIVRDLFYNTPARMKFLKRDSVEGSYISGAVQRQALAHPEIAFRFIRDGKAELSTPGDGKLLSAIYAAMGRQSAMEMVELRGNSSGVQVTGFAGKPTANRGSRGYQHFFVNGRYVKSKMMTAALEEAYKNQIMTGRFPIGVIHVNVPPTAVDVNVHPAKTEVKFLREGDVFDAIRYTVMGAIRTAEDRPEVNIRQVKPQTAPQNNFYQTMNAQEYREKLTGKEQADTKRFLEALSKRAEAPRGAQGAVHDSVRLAPGTTGAVSIPPVTAAPVQPKAQVKAEPELPKGFVGTVSPVSEEDTPKKPTPTEPEQTSMDMPKVPTPAYPPPAPQPKTEVKEKTSPYRIIGQTMDTYILVEQGDELLLIDKHAAHERVLFEKLKAQKHEIMSQILLQPIQAELSREETAILLSKTEELEKLGFSVEDFGGGTLLVRAVPCDIDEKDAEACLAQVAQNYLDGLKTDPETVHDELLHTIACKAAIKGGRKTDPKELSALVAEIMAREDIQHCPHGRPVCIRITRGNLERQFKRA